MSTFTCLYCGGQKQQEESSIEHVIPQFLGGEYAPKFFQISNVCTTCNNRLGLWVDASYAKSWLITNHLAEAARLLCTKLDDPGLPLRCLGKAQIPSLRVSSDHVPEYWIGPSGETIVWIRPQDDRMNPYAGGNPIETKKKPSVAYFVPVSANAEKHELGLNSFHKAMEKRKVRKIICAEPRDANGNSLDPTSCGFDAPTDDDLANRTAIAKAIDSGGIPIQVALDVKFDQRFICKLALGVGYSLFGDDYLAHSISSEARKGVWPARDGSKSTIRGSATLALADSLLSGIVGYPGSISIIVTRIDLIWCMSVCIDEKLPFVIELGSGSMVSPHINPEEGYALLLFPYLKSHVELPLSSLIAHKQGVINNQELEKIDIIRMSALQFNAQLSVDL